MTVQFHERIPNFKSAVISRLKEFQNLRILEQMRKREVFVDVGKIEALQADIFLGLSQLCNFGWKIFQFKTDLRDNFCLLILIFITFRERKR